MRILYDTYLYNVITSDFCLTSSANHVCMCKVKIHTDFTKKLKF